MKHYFVVVLCCLFFSELGYAGEHTIEGGGIYYDLDEGYESTYGEYFRARFETSVTDAWTFDITNLDRFNDDGTQITVGNVHQFTDRLYTQLYVAGSSGGFFWPRMRVDGAISVKWLEDKQFVTTVGGGYFDAKDEHDDTKGFVDLTYWFENLLVLSAGYQLNVSEPGTIHSTSGYVVASYVKDKTRIMSIRGGLGDQAYQALPGGIADIDFPFHSIRVTWREWVGETWGINLAAEHYSSEVYDQNGFELGFFVEF